MPKLDDGCYPLCYSLVSGLSSTPERGDKMAYFMPVKVVFISIKKKSHSCKQKWENCYEKEYYY